MLIKFVLSMLMAGCSVPSTPPVAAPPDSEIAARYGFNGDGLARSSVAGALDEDVLAIRFDDEGLFARLPSQSWVAIANTAGEGAGRHPEGMTDLGRDIPALRTWLQSQFGTRPEPREVLVFAPSGVSYAPIKSIFRMLHEFGGARVAHVAVRSAAGSIQTIRVPYGDSGSVHPASAPTLRILLDGKGMTLEGLGDLAPRPRMTFRCDGPCQGPETYQLEAIGRLGVRLFTKYDAKKVLVIPHNDVQWDVVIAALDVARADPRPGHDGPMFSEATIAGMRPLLRTLEEMEQDVLERAKGPGQPK